MIPGMLATFGPLWNELPNRNHILTAHRRSQSAGVFMSKRVTFSVSPTHIGRERRYSLWTQKHLEPAFNYTGYEAN